MEGKPAPSHFGFLLSVLDDPILVTPNQAFRVFLELVHVCLSNAQRKALPACGWKGLVWAIERQLLRMRQASSGRMVL